jgi:hypothetical protein
VVVVVVVEPMVVVVVTIGMQAVAPGGAVVPRGHGRQAMLAGSGANVSAAQRLHDDDPAEPAKLPAGQASQRSAPEALENVPGRHGRQGSVPVRLNDPGAQASGRVVVVVTTVVVVVVTRVQADEPGGAVVPGGHGRQMVDPSAGWNVSAAHGVQLVEPSVSAKVPAGHSEHTIVPGVLEKVPTRQGAHSGSEPVGLNSPGGQSCARAEEEEMRSMRSTAQTRVMNDPLWAGRLQRARSESQEKKWGRSGIHCPVSHPEELLDARDQLSVSAAGSWPTAIPVGADRSRARRCDGSWGCDPHQGRCVHHVEHRAP